MDDIDKKEIWEDRVQNIACAAAIDNAIGCNHDGYHFESDKALNEVLRQYDSERIGFVLGSTIYRAQFDGRYSSSNKIWAKQYAVAVNAHEFALNAHPILLDRLTEVLRERVEHAREADVAEKVRENTRKDKPGKKKPRGGISR